MRVLTPLAWSMCGLARMPARMPATIRAAGSDGRARASGGALAHASASTMAISSPAVRG